VVLNCPLGVEIPEGDCAIRVGPEVRRWKVGKCLVFDPSFEHEVWNRTDRNRTVLQVSFLRPELSAVEQQAITAAAGRSVGQRSSRGHAVVKSESS
jgi:aspartyl/asparaginyl beta-hydroxylase (cupin superfamily)